MTTLEMGPRLEFGEAPTEAEFKAALVEVSNAPFAHFYDFQLNIIDGKLIIYTYIDFKGEKRPFGPKEPLTSKIREAAKLLGFDQCEISREEPSEFPKRDGQTGLNTQATKKHGVNGLENWTPNGRGEPGDENYIPPQANYM